MTDNKIRVRYAPSPTGHLHIGNARTALFNYLFARHNKGTFVIRIEDTDIKRNVTGGEQSQLENLKWLGIDWDEGPDVGGDFGPYRQSERQAIYQKYIQQLLDAGVAYESYKTEEELAQQREAQKARGVMPHYENEFAGMTDEERQATIEKAQAQGIKPVIRIKVPENKIFEWNDMVKGNVQFASDSIGGDWVIQKRDGMPTYNFAVVIDDHLMEISHVLRGDDHVANTPKQLMIYDYLGWQAPTFGHMTLIINSETGKKLSKRDETVLQFIEQYRQRGYLPEAMFNFITLLGWSPVGEDEIFNQKQFIKQFDPKRLSKSPAAFDQKKLEWVNNQYVKAADLSRITDMSIVSLLAAGKIASADLDTKTLEWLRSLVSLFKDQMSYTDQIVELSDIFFTDPVQLSEEAMAELEKDEAMATLTTFQDEIANLPRFTATQIMQAIQETRAKTGVKGRKLFMPVRIATTRSMHGPGIGEAIELLGYQKAQEHITQTLQQLEK
ncbi:glutamate--tRNA ligase [Bombilactobacillus thymidiniphilus]|uniref:Glutamate--tRNA ligase n=1 Tax=Bombilactobacillus thymidiniphilus TaxID=2923363 RepID=A0ABY4PEL9_9LACO|nr:glutamate--tRNA ligase [Bombilactobacillus thymidiniphilus]UQS83949.1 glutamate--tRNA ligase [Bombilactobacillus thymidiniphilus]